MSGTRVVENTGAGVIPGDGIRERLVRKIPVEDRRLDAAGIPTAFLEGGSGPPVVLLHGPGEFGLVWTPVIPGLVASHRVIAPDLPGQGASGTGDGELSPERVLDWLDALVADTCSTPPVLVGHLLGGAIAARFAAARPDRVDRLVLVDSFGLGPFRPSPAFLLAMIGFLARPSERSRERLFRRCFVDLDGVRTELHGRFELMEAYALECARDASGKAALRTLMGGFALRAIPSVTLARIAAPTTLIWGRHDPQARLRVAERASARYGWPLHVIDDVGDDPVVERPEEFLQALRAALGEESAGARS